MFAVAREAVAVFARVEHAVWADMSRYPTKGACTKIGVAVTGIYKPPKLLAKKMLLAADVGTSAAVRVSHAGALPLVPVPVWRKNLRVVVVFGLKRVVVSVLLWYGIEPSRVVLFPPIRLAIALAHERVPEPLVFKT